MFTLTRGTSARYITLNAQDLHLSILFPDVTVFLTTYQSYSFVMQLTEENVNWFYVTENGKENLLELTLWAVYFLYTLFSTSSIKENITIY